MPVELCIGQGCQLAMEQRAETDNASYGSDDQVSLRSAKLLFRVPLNSRV